MYMSFADEHFGQRKSYLSANVKKLVCIQEDELVSTSTVDRLFLDDGMLNWTWIENQCSLKECLTMLDSPDYRLAVSRLQPVTHVIYNHLCGLTSNEFLNQYKVQLEWTRKSDIIHRAFNLLKASYGGYVEASLLLITATIERLLGDIYMSFSRADHCPLLLRDLLKMGELKTVLGETVMFCLEVCIGPPTGLNLRNLAWHGFLSPGEVPPPYVSFLLMLAISFGEVIRENLKEHSFSEVQIRPLITYPEKSLLQGIFPEIRAEEMLGLFRRSHFVTSAMSSLWDLAMEFYTKERFGDVVIVMLPQLEHSLRRVYACCSHLPERLQTAESSEFYTTFSEILSPLLPNGTENRMLSEIGPGFTELLLDIFVYQEGPRLRDHLGHGEVDLHHFPKYFADHILSISAAFCVRFPVDNSCKKKPLTEFLEKAQSYLSVYHPLACLKREHFHYINDLFQWKKLLKPSDEDFVFVSSDFVFDTAFCTAITDVLLKRLGHPFPNKTRCFTQEDSLTYHAELLEIATKILTDTTLCTLFRPRHELEIVALLRNIVNQSLRTSKQIQETAKSRFDEWEKKTLRSRQRNNYRRFWLLVPSLTQIMSLFAVIVVVEMREIEKACGHDESQIKYLKRCLQCAQNLASLSSSSKNRWQECAEFGKVWMKHTQLYYGKKFAEKAS